jgi:exosome complex exonuclease RRP6
VSTSPLRPEYYNASTLQKPQLKFNRQPNNEHNIRWLPQLTSKPHAIIPLANYCAAPEGIELSHPYDYEIRHISYPKSLFQHHIPQKYRAFHDTPFHWIDTREGLDLLLSALKGVRELAIDLEHHDYRTFSGFLCLMQLSTRTDDYIVDTLALRDELEELNDFFADPAVVKVI